jgi:hypothetical protein
MYAIIRKNAYDPAKLAHAGPALAEFQDLHAAQPGYAGSIDVDAGDGKRIIVNLWQTEQDARRHDSARAAPAAPAGTADGGPIGARRGRRNSSQRPDTAAVNKAATAGPEQLQRGRAATGVAAKTG